MDTQAMTALEIEPAIPSTFPAASHANDRWKRSPTREPARRAITRWLVDAVLRGGADGPAFYGEIWRDPTTLFPRLSSPPEREANSTVFATGPFPFSQEEGPNRREKSGLAGETRRSNMSDLFASRSTKQWLAPSVPTL
jgi:hypothetical protein